MQRCYSFTLIQSLDWIIFIAYVMTDSSRRYIALYCTHADCFVSWLKWLILLTVHAFYYEWMLDVHFVLMMCVSNTSTAAWASYQICKIAGCACAGNAGNVFPRRRFQRKPLVSDPGMHHGTCVTHVPWCMSGLLTCGDGENVPGIPGACATEILRIW